jgi:predicted nucleic acid-binding protein
MDTSGLYAIFNHRDTFHQQMKAVRNAEPGPYVVPCGIMAELAWMTEQTLGARVVRQFLLDIADGNYLIDCGDQDFRRIRELMQRYADLRLGFVDSAVIACAERHGGRVLTCDRRHFSVVARGERSIVVVPE